MKWIYCLVMLLLCASPVFSQADSPPAIDALPDDHHVMPAVVVRADHLESDTATITRRELELMPSATGSITEALKGQSQIQYDYDQQSSLTLGEIAPPRISISGAKPYENNFMIDGVSVSNTLNPSGFDESPNQYDLAVGGADTTIFYDTHLLESVTVYSSNVPAQYGGFVGGVVDARLRDPQADRWRFKLTGRYTEDSWFKLRGVERDSETPTNQPRFKTYHTNIVADGPLNDQAALLLSASRRHSVIPLHRSFRDGSISKDDQYRTSENYHVRLTLNPSNDLKVNLDTTLAPYEEKRWRNVWPESEWKTNNRSLRFASQAEYTVLSGVLTARAAYGQNGYSRDSSNNYRYSFTNLADTSQNNQFGGVGDASVKNRELNVALGFVTNDFHSGPLLLNLATGIDYGNKRTKLWNEAAVVETDVAFVTGTRSRLMTLVEYDESNQSQSLDHFGAYLQTELYWNRFMVRPGLRADYDDYAHNFDVAPRFKAEYDVFGNQTLRLMVGANRYYGQQLRAYAFKRYRPNTRTQYSSFFDGTESSTVVIANDKTYRSNGLETPYSDELTTGVYGDVHGWSYSLILVQRKHKKQLISRTEDQVDYYMTNDGKSRYQGATFTLARSVATSGFGHHLLSLGATKSKTRSFNGSYFSEFYSGRVASGFDYHYDRVFYNGSLISRSDLPADNYNAPLILTVTVGSSFFDDRLRLLSFLRWRDSSKGLLKDDRFSDDTPYGTRTGRNDQASSEWLNSDGSFSDAYRDGKISGGAITDLTIEFDLYRKTDRTFTVVGEIVNIFNGNMQTGIASDGTGSGAIHGRGFYAGFQMAF